MSDWQGIESAPKDGTPFLGYWPRAYQGKGGQFVMVWHEDGLYTNSAYKLNVTNWMPLPPPPGAKDESAA